VNLEAELEITHLHEKVDFPTEEVLDRLPRGEVLSSVSQVPSAACCVICSRQYAPRSGLSTQDSGLVHRHVISNVQLLSPWHWHFDSVTVGSLAPWRSIDSMK
jgi:hypothetical protein